MLWPFTSDPQMISWDEFPSLTQGPAQSLHSVCSMTKCYRHVTADSKNDGRDAGDVEIMTEG